RRARGRAEALERGALQEPRRGRQGRRGADAALQHGGRHVRRRRARPAARKAEVLTVAITIVDTAKVATASGEYGTVNSITVDLPAGLAAGDVVHVAVCLPRYRWYQAQGLHLHLTRQYGVSVPTGWQAAGSYAFNSQYNLISQGIIVLLRKVATGAEASSVTIPISRTDYRPEVTPDGEVLQVAAALVAHRGVNVSSPYASPPVFKLGGDVPWNSGDSALSRLAQLAFGVGIDPDNANTGVGEEFPAWDDPTPTKGQPT